jgi:hypothetical protein
MKMRNDDLLERLSGPEAALLTLEQKLEIAALVRVSPGGAQELDRRLITQNEAMRQGLMEARALLEKLEQRLQAAAQPPWFPAVYLGTEELSRGRAAFVAYNGQPRVVSVDENEVDLSALTIGKEVLLSEALNQLLAPSPYQPWHTGETASFVRLLPDGRLLLESRDEEMMAYPAGGCDATALRKGDKVRFDRATHLAFEALAASTGEEYFIESTPHETFEEHVGGLDAEVERLRRALLTRFIHSDKAALHGVGRLRSVLLEGSTGVGKTLIARALANLLGRLSPSGRCSFAAVRPGSFGSVYYSATERNIHNFCESLRAAASRQPGVPVVAFLDEIDGLAGVRSDRDQRHYAEITNALLAELDGFEESRFLVVSATNRLSSLDPAARRRLGDLELHIPRPGRRAAAEIFRKHVGLDRPYQGTLPPEEARERIIQAAVAAIFAPNGDNHLCTLMYRNGALRKVCGKDLISGAEIQRMVAFAAGEACRRDVEYGECGLSLDDMLYGVDRFIETAAAPLTPLNVRNYIELEDDIDVVKIQRPVRAAAGAVRLRVA